jgi:hypothetical protein
MDSQHRHQLQQNDLGQIALQAKPWLEQHLAKLIAAVIGVLVVVIGASIWLNSKESSQSEAWGKLYSARTVDEFGKVADEHPGSLAAAWSRLKMAELNLESGIAAMFTDRELALKDLAAAKKEFDTVLSSTADVPDGMRERAMFGLAHCLEAQSDGDTGPAIEAYQALIQRHPATIYKTQAEARIKELQSPEAKEFYAWFHKQSPKPAGLPRPQDGIPGANLPAGSPFHLPPAVAPGTTPVAPSGDQKPTTDNPTDEKPAEEKPADPKPADEKPAAEKPAGEPDPK